MAHLAVQRASSVVSVNHVPAEKTIGSALWYPLGAGPSAFINWAMAEMPKQISEIDKQADPFLEKLILILEQLAGSWNDKADPDSTLLKTTIEMLNTFLEHTDRVHLLYPQVMNAKPTSTSTAIQAEEQKEIEEAKSKAAVKTQELFATIVVPLLYSLKSYQPTSMTPKCPPLETLSLIEQLKNSLNDIVYEQRSVVAKLLHTIKSVATQVVKEGWANFKNQRKDESGVSNHPLMHLLAVISKYPSGEDYLPCDKKRDLVNALRILDTHCLSFKGIYERLSRELDSPNPDLSAVQSKVTEFIRTNLKADLASQNEIHTCAASFILNRKKELLNKTIFDYKLKKDEELLKIIEELEKVYRHIDKTEQLQAAVEAKRKAHASHMQRFQDVEKRLDEECAAKVRQIDSNDFWSAVERNKVEWGKLICLNDLKRFPKEFFNPAVADEIIWKAVAYHEQKQQWQALKAQIASERVKDPKAIIKSLQLSVEALQKYASIEPGLETEEKRRSMELLKGYIIDWMNYAKEQMLAFEQSTWEKGKINTAFNEAVIGLKKGELIESIMGIQNFVRESNFWIAVWRDSPSPLGSLATSFKKFCEVTPPPAPPKAAPEVRKVLKKSADAAWKSELLPEANQIEKEQVLENALALTCFEFIAHLLGLNGDKTATYRRLMDAMDAIKQLADVNAESLKPILRTFLGKESVREAKLLESLVKCHAEYGASKREYHKQLYLALVSSLIYEQGNSVSAWTAWSSFRLVYDLVELFIRPFSERIFSEIDGVVNNTPGTLNRKHLVPIQGVTKALSTYHNAMNSWEREFARQTEERGVGRAPGKMLTGAKDDISVLLDGSYVYDGMTPEEITLKMGFAVVDQIQLPDYARSIAGVIGKVKDAVLTRRVNNTILNAPVMLGQGVLSIPVFAVLCLTYIVVKIITSAINFFVQQGVKVYLWKTNAINQALDQMLNTLLIDVESAPILDTLLLEQLQELLIELKKGTPPDNSGAAAGDESSRTVISAALHKLFQVIEIDKYSSVDDLKMRDKSGIMPQIKQTAFVQLEKLLSTVLVNTSKSLLQKEQVDALLFEIFRIANEGLRGGSQVFLTQEQKAALTQRLTRPPSEKEILDEGKRIALDNLEKIPKVLSEIRDTAINPALDKVFDESVQTRSQLLLDYITWMQGRLFSPKENGSKRNAIHFVKGKLEEFRQIGADKGAILREIHFVYGQFIQEMEEFQTRLDGYPSPNSPELNQFVLKELMPTLEELTSAITNFIKKSEEGEYNLCQDKLLAFDAIQVKVSTELAKIEEAEKNRVMGMKAGVQGLIETKVEEGLLYLKNGSKGLSHSVVQMEIDKKLEEIRNLFSNKVLIKHAILWQMRLYLNPEFAFKA